MVRRGEGKGSALSSLLPPCHLSHPLRPPSHPSRSRLPALLQWFCASSSCLGCVVHFVAMPFLGRKMEEKRMRTTDSEVYSAPFLVVSVRVWRSPLQVSDTCIISFPAKVKKAVALDKTEFGQGIVVPRPQLARLIACNVELPARFGASRTRSRPGPSPLYAVVFAAGPVCAEVPVFNPKQVAAAGYLVAARILLGLTAKDAVISKVSFVATQKFSRERLQQIPTAEVPARFGASRTRTRPRRFPPPWHLHRTGARAHTSPRRGRQPGRREGLHRARPRRTPRRTAACPIFFDPSDDDDVPFKFDLGLAGPAPPVTIPAIVVESPSLDLGDKRLAQEQLQGFASDAQASAVVHSTPARGLQWEEGRQQASAGSAIVVQGAQLHRARVSP
ncbi:hypothetical protein B0H13DRAFT_2281794 [Mycena leptocephala]|nr:hypothetical protein B0H13DRAFT_2281794 [Mycena leptocephala]